MKAKSLARALAVCLWLLNLSLSPPAYGGARIDLVVEHGVDKEAETQVRSAINTTIDFFQNTYGLSLEKNIRVLAAPDKLNYKEAIKQWYGASDAMAGYQADRSVGLQSRGTIIVDLGERRNRHGKIFTLCHEIVHHYQSQESRDRHGAIRWMTEGVADVIAAHILETAGISGVDFKQRTLAILKRTQNWPKLENLHTPKDMEAANRAYGSGVTYGTAGLAVLTLVEWRGYQPLFAYFRALKNTSPEEAFYQAFGARVSDFEKQFRPF